MKLQSIGVYVILCVFLTTWANAQVTKIEPPFWWSDMTKQDLQIMFYGPNIAQGEVVIHGQIITNVFKTENPNYIFVTLDVAEISPGWIKIDLVQKGLVVETINYEFKIRQEDSKWREGFNSSDLVYLVMPDRFANGDLSNDNINGMRELVNRENPGGRHGGDIRGIINNLNYIHELGATAIWSTPLLKDDHEVYSYHHYAQDDVYQVDPRFGTNEEYVELSDSLRSRDMKLIMDYVTNHWSSLHWMMNDMPTYDWIHQFKEYTNTNHHMTTQFDSHASVLDSKILENGWFVKTMPDLNQSNPLVLNYLIQNALWWIEYANLGGFRVDTYSYNNKAAIAEWTKAIMDEYPNFNIVGEAWYHEDAQISYWQKDSPIAAIQNYNSHCPSVMDFVLHDKIMKVFQTGQTQWADDFDPLYNHFANDFLFENVDNIMIFLENHDTNRFNEIYGDISTFKMALTLMATLRGIPQIYYGSEIGMKGEKKSGDGDIRRDFPGGWKADHKNAFTDEGRTVEQREFFDFSKRLFNWRKSKTVVHTGRTMQFAPIDDVYVYFRFNDHEQVMVIINNSQDDRILNLSQFKERLNDLTSATEILSNTKVSLQSALKISGRSSMILEF